MRKRFGQHFLVDPVVCLQLIAAIAPQSADCILEIGAGDGALTIPLAARCAQLTALEIDRDLMAQWQRRLRPKNLHLIAADALHYDYTMLLPASPLWRIAGNLPYNIATELILRLLPLGSRWRDAHFLVQREVAWRLCATTGDAHYGRLTLFRQYYAHATLLCEVAPEHFRPPPRVQSAWVRLVPHRDPIIKDIDDTALFKLIQLAFAHRRKKLRSSLQAVIERECWRTLPVNPNQRPEQVSLQDFVQLCRALMQKKPQLFSSGILS